MPPPRRLAKTSSSRISLRSYRIRITFCVQGNTQFGERISVIGASTELGHWKIGKDVELKWHQDGTWQKTIEFQRQEGENLEFEYKLIAVRGNGTTQVCWEGGGNRHFMCPAGDAGSVTAVIRRDSMLFPDYPEWHDYGLALFRDQSFTCAGGMLQFTVTNARPKHKRILADFFANLSESTRTRYGVHPLTYEYACEACEYDSELNRMKSHLIIISPGPRLEVVGYLLLDHNYIKHEYERYSRYYHIHLESPLDIFFAPVMSDKHQNKGIASCVIPSIKQHILDIQGRSIMLLGGVQRSNEIAMHFYKKEGFVEMGEFEREGVMSVDMRCIMVHERSRIIFLRNKPSWHYDRD
eukprot:CFRG5099T1